MPPRRRIDPAAGREALQAWARAADAASTPGLPSGPDGVPRTTVATAVRWTLEELAARAPGRTLEVRVPPFGVTQCVEGPRHSRGTPPNVVETDPATWLALASGRLTWAQAVDGGLVRASGSRADLTGLLPLAGA